MTFLHPHRSSITRWLAAGLLLLCVAWPRVAAAQTVQLAKTSLGGSGTFTFTTTNLSSGGEDITTASPGVTVLSPIIADVVLADTVVTISETVPPGWLIVDASCEDTSGGTTGTFGTLAGGTLTLGPDEFTPGATIVCTFSNVLASVDLAITKQASPTVVASGGTVTYTLTASNVGSVDVTNAVVADTPGTGLSCTSAGTCAASGGASCPVSVPAAALFGAGFTVPSLPVGTSVQITVPCTVTASGN